MAASSPRCRPAGSIEAAVADPARPVRAVNAEIIGTTTPGRADLAVTRELWGEDGRLVAINQQTIVVMV